MAAPVYEQNKWFRRFQSITDSYLPISVVMILVSAVIYILVKAQITDLGLALILYSVLVMMFWVIAFVAVYHFIVKRMLIANLSKLFRQLSEGSEELFVIVTKGKYSLFSKSQFAKELSRMSRSGIIHPLVYEGILNEVLVEFIKSIEVYDFRQAGHRACLEQYLQQLRGHIECLEAEPAKIMQRLSEVRAEEERYRGYLVGQPA